MVKVLFNDSDMKMSVHEPVFASSARLAIQPISQLEMATRF